MIRLLSGAGFLVLAASMGSAMEAVSPVDAERAAVFERWRQSRLRNPTRFEAVSAMLRGSVAGLLASQVSDGPEAGSWGRAGDEWRFRATGENCLILAVAARLPDGGVPEDRETVAAVAAGLDLLASRDRDGRWHASDSNVDRFCLAPAAEAFILLADVLPPERLDVWRDMFRRAGEYQMRSYLPRTSWGNGLYPNMDAYFSLSVSLAGVICGRPEWADAAAGVVRRLGQNCLLPNGAYEYVDGWNPVPVYQDILPIILGRYALLTGDEEALRQLRGTVEYYPWFSEVSGACDNGMTPFIKHYWSYDGHAAAPEFTAWLTGDGRNRTVADRRMCRLKSAYWTALMPQWLTDTPGEPLPREFLRANPDVAGFHMRTEGRFTAWITGRQSAHDTFVSATDSDPEAIPLQRQSLAAFLTEVEGLPEPPPTGAKARLIFADDLGPQPTVRTEVGVDIPISPETVTVERDIDVPAGADRLRVDLFMFFRAGSVVWDRVELLDSAGRNLLPNPDFRELTEQGIPEGWEPGSYGTGGRMEVVAGDAPGDHAVRSHAPSDRDRASWICTLEVESGATYRFLCRARTEDIAPGLPEAALVHYVTDMAPDVTSVSEEDIAVQRAETGLHAMGPGVRYPTPLAPAWRWACWQGGNPEPAAWRTAQTWVLFGGRLFGLHTVRCTTPSTDGGVRLRPVVYPDTVPRVVERDAFFEATVPRLGFVFRPGPGLESASRLPGDVLRVDLPDGDYRCEVTAGDPDYPLLPMVILAGGAEIPVAGCGAGEWSGAEFPLAVRGGHAALGFRASPGEHWKLTSLRMIRAGNAVVQLDAGPAAETPAGGYTRLDGGRYRAERGFGWGRDLASQERVRAGGDGVRKTLITAPAKSDLMAFAVPGGRRQGDEIRTLDVGVGSDTPPREGTDWGFLGEPGDGLRGWWGSTADRILVVVSNDGLTVRAIDLAVPGADGHRRIRALAGPVPRLARGRVTGVEIASGTLAVWELR